MDQHCLLFFFFLRFNVTCTVTGREEGPEGKTPTVGAGSEEQISGCRSCISEAADKTRLVGASKQIWSCPSASCTGRTRH